MKHLYFDFSFLCAFIQSFTKKISQLINKQMVAHSFSSISVVLPTGPARNLSVTQVTWGSVSVGWMPPKNYSDPAMLYEIECKRGNWSLIKEVVDEHVTFDDLQENTWYKIEVKVGAKGVGFYHGTTGMDFRTQGFYHMIFLEYFESCLFHCNLLHYKT